MAAPFQPHTTPGLIVLEQTPEKATLKQQLHCEQYKTYSEQYSETLALYLKHKQKAALAKAALEESDPEHEEETLALCLKH